MLSVRDKTTSSPCSELMLPSALAAGICRLMRVSQAIKWVKLGERVFYLERATCRASHKSFRAVISRQPTGTIVLRQNSFMGLHTNKKCSSDCFPGFVEAEGALSLRVKFSLRRGSRIAQSAHLPKARIFSIEKIVRRRFTLFTKFSLHRSQLHFTRVQCKSRRLTITHRA
ncbi:hypothetical protein Plhal304r1_c008g0033441 [Plasmopara halstedii]